MKLLNHQGNLTAAAPMGLLLLTIILCCLKAGGVF